MPKAATATTTKTTRKAKSSTAKETTTKSKRAPSAYNLFMAEHLKKWKADNPGAPIKEGMAAVAAMWRDAPENPKRGQEPAEKKAKATTKKPAAKKKPAKEVSDEDEDEE